MFPMPLKVTTGGASHSKYVHIDSIYWVRASFQPTDWTNTECPRWHRAGQSDWVASHCKCTQLERSASNWLTQLQIPLLGWHCSETWLFFAFQLEGFKAVGFSQGSLWPADCLTCGASSSLSFSPQSSFLVVMDKNLGLPPRHPTLPFHRYKRYHTLTRSWCTTQPISGHISVS